MLLAGLLLIGCHGELPSGSPDVAETLAPLTSVVPTMHPSPTAPPTTSSPPPSVPTFVPTIPPTTEPDPTVRPDPTRANVFPPRTAVEINDRIKDRPGVPVALRDRYWWTFRGADVGLLGTTAQLGIPSDETILDAAGALVVSRRPTPNEPGGSEIVVREFETGETVRRFRTQMGWLEARLIGRRLFWAGLGDGVACSDPAVDGGVWAVDLDGGEPVAIVKPGKVLSGCMTGRQILVSPSGGTVGAVMNSYGPDNWIDVVDASSLAHHRIRDVWPDAITDDTFIQWDQQPTDGIAAGLGGMTAHDLRTGAARWTFPGGRDVKHFGPSRFLAFGARFYVEYTWSTNSGTDFVLATFEPLTGERRELVKQLDTGYDRVALIRPELSSASHVGLEVWSSAERPRPRSITVVDVKSGDVTWDAYTIDPPWLCYPDRCIRD